MNLSRRIETLEKVIGSDPRTLHAITVGDDETPEEASTRYCLENNFDEEKFINGELGMVIKVIHV